MSIKVEKNVPIPGFGIESRKYPLDEMEIKDSFFVQKTDGSSIRELQQNISKGIQYFYKVNGRGKKFICRSVEGGVRVWRVE